jgi:phosphatidylinositol alpha-1,6-mannosyltransferase
MILFATQNFLPSIGGTQLYVTGLADALAARGHAVEVYCDAASKAAAAQVDSARTYPIRRFGGLRPVMRRNKAWAVMQRLASGGVRAVVTDTWKSLEHISADALAGVNVLCLAHGSEFLVPKDGTKERRMRECLAKASVVAANSHFTAALAEPHIGGKTALRVILPGVDPPVGASADFRSQGSATAPRLLTIARLEPRKGVDAVLRALPALAREYPDITYDVIGKGEDRVRLLGLAEQLGMSNRVRFHGYISERQKAPLLNSATLFLMPNRREPGSVEGFGIVFVEAAAFGVPSIAGSDGGTSDAVRHERTGLVVDGANDRAIESAISTLLANGAARERMGIAAHRRFWSEFAWPAAVHRFEEALGLG